jgi:hypothetical protein
MVRTKRVQNAAGISEGVVTCLDKTQEKENMAAPLVWFGA